MTAEQYMDKKRFPLTTVDGVTLDEQLEIDLINWDGLEQMKSKGHKLDKEQYARLFELRRKSKFNPRKQEAKSR